MSLRKMEMVEIILSKPWDLVCRVNRYVKGESWYLDDKLVFNFLYTIFWTISDKFGLGDD